MGILRTILAISVVFTHISLATSNWMVGGKLAVEVFSCISGFFITYVLNQTKVYASARMFYLNRFLRIYPVYLVVAFCVLIVQLFLPSDFQDFYKLPHSAWRLLIQSNLVPFGQDAVMFTSVKGGHLIWSGNFMDSDVPVWHGLLIPQAWTLGVELMF
jgi:peptidoglycan/LPS O-acetylase OafA/YrhL